MSWSRLAFRRARFSPSGYVGLALTQDVAHVLGVGGEPHGEDAEIGVEHVAPLDDDVVLLELLTLPLNFDRGLEPGAHGPVVHLLPEPPDDVGVGGDAGSDDLVRERRGDEVVDDLHHLDIMGHHRRHADREVVEREELGRDEARRPLGPERPLEKLALARGEPVGESEGLRYVDGDGLGPALLDDVTKRSPLDVEVDLTLGVLGVLRGGVEAAFRAAADGNSLDARLRSPIVEDEDRSPPREEASGGNERHGRRDPRCTRSSARSTCRRGSRA